MSLKAGGVGLNLTAASNVFLMVTCHSQYKQNIDFRYIYFFFSFPPIYHSFQNTGSLVESCSGRASNHEDPSNRPEKAGPSEEVHCQGGKIII